MNTVNAALCVIPSGSTHEEINNLRAVADKAFPRWMPHMNLIYPCLPEDVAQQSGFFRRIQQQLAEVDPFQCDLSTVGMFDQGGKGGGGCTIHLRPGGLASNHMRLLYAAVVEAYPIPQEDSSASFKPHLTVAQYPLPAGRAHGVFADCQDKDEVNAVVEKQKLTIKFTCREICYITRAGGGAPFEVRRRFKLGKPFQGKPQAPCGSVLKIPRPIYTRKGVAAVEVAMLLPLALEMTKAWLGRSDPVKLPRTVTKLERAIHTFCTVRVKLDTDALLQKMIEEKWVKPAPYTIRKTGAEPSASRSVISVGRGRGGAAPRNGKPDKVAVNIPGIHLRPTPCEPCGPLLLEDLDNEEVLGKKLQYFVYKMSSVKLRIQKDIFIRQLQDVGTTVGVVPPSMVIQSLIDDNSMEVSHLDQDGEAVISRYLGARVGGIRK